MKWMMSLLLVTPMMVSAASASAEDRYTPEPPSLPSPRFCPEGTRRVFDEYAGRYICVKKDDHEPRPWRTEQMKELLETLGGDDQSAKGTALNGLFDAAMSGDAPAVAAPSAPRLIQTGAGSAVLNEAARKAREEFDRRMTEEANRRRDAGDEKLRKGNEDKKKAEEKWPKK